MNIFANYLSVPLKKSFGISRGVKTTAEVLRARITDGDHTGFGEAVPYARYQDSCEIALSQISKLPHEFNRADLLDLLTAGSARNAVDAALIDLRSKQTGLAAWKLLGLPEPIPVPMCFTISLQETNAMIAEASANGHLPVLKIKLGGSDDKRAILGIANAAPTSKLIVDVNEGWGIAAFQEMIPVLAEAGVQLLEQPLPAHLDSQIASVDCPIPLCADESISPGMKISEVSPAYSFVNLKLDKSGGLSNALTQLSEAKDLGLGVMVGCMVGTSLAMAPGFLLAQQADYVDLDGFLHVAEDFRPSMRFQDGLLSSPGGLWG
jgi:L-alanine-DL-glutamate epimerase-like enolase superfamily enzyme